MPDPEDLYDKEPTTAERKAALRLQMTDWALTNAHTLPEREVALHRHLLEWIVREAGAGRTEGVLGYPNFPPADAEAELQSSKKKRKYRHPPRPACAVAEANIVPVLQALAKDDNFCVAMPVVRMYERKTDQMLFHEMRPEDPFSLAALQERPEWHVTMEWLNRRRIYTLLLPVIAWSRLGAFVGNGNGGYDDLIKEVIADRAFRCKMRVFGVGYDGQRVQEIPQEPHDKNLHGVFMESGLHLPMVE